MKKFLFGAGVVVAGLLVTGGPAQAGQKAEACAGYFYQGTDTTLCDLFPGSKDRDCAEMARPVLMVKKGVDPWRLDRDGNGVGCEKGDAQPVDDGGKITPGTSAGGALPKTGPGAALAVGGGALVVGAGAVFVLARRRKVKFVA